MSVLERCRELDAIDAERFGRPREDIDIALHEQGIERHEPLADYYLGEAETTCRPINHFYGSDSVVPATAPAGGEDLMEWYKLKRKDKSRDKIRRPCSLIGVFHASTG